MKTYKNIVVYGFITRIDDCIYFCFISVIFCNVLGTDVGSIDYYGRSPLQLAQSKLKLLQRGVANEDSKVVKEEVCQVIDMMLAYLHKRGQEIEAELLGAFSSRLTLSNTREEVETGVRDLLASLASLTLEKSENDQAKSADKE